MGTSPLHILLSKVGPCQQSQPSINQEAPLAAAAAAAFAPAAGAVVGAAPAAGGDRLTLAM